MKKWDFEGAQAKLMVRDPVASSPWTHELFSSRYKLVLDQQLQGVSYKRENERFVPLTRDYRYFFLRDDETGECWSLNYSPVGTPAENYLCEFGPSSVKLSGSIHGVTHGIEVVVPWDESGEHWFVNLRNNGTQTRRLSLFYAVGLAYHADRGTNAWFDPGNHLLLHDNPETIHDFERDLNSAAGQRSVCFLASDRPVASWDTSEWAFFGGNELHSRPQAVLKGHCTSRCARAVPIGAALHWALELQSGESWDVGLLLDAACSPEDAVARKTRFLSTDFREKMRAELERRWNEFFSWPRLQSPDANLDRFFNVWAKRQAILMTVTDRGENFVTARNRLQDLLGYGLLNPAESWIRFKEILRHQDSSGHLSRGWSVSGATKDADLNNLDFRDGSFWAVFVGTVIAPWQMAAACWQEEVSFSDDETPVSVYEHLKRAYRSLMPSRGKHGLILLGQGDWNDALNRPGMHGRGESTMLSANVVYAARRFERIARELEDPGFAEELRGDADRLAAAINRHCWDGEWYVRGFDDDGRPFGSSSEKEGRIWLNAQVWPILAGIVPEERVERLFRMIERELETPAGLVLLVPPFTQTDPRLGSITTRLVGARVNGSVYNHAVIFACVAALKAGRRDTALRWLGKVMPTNSGNPPEASGQPPTYFPNYYVGPVGDGTEGTSSRMSHTGTASWFMWCVGEILPGIEVRQNGIALSPNLPSAWGKAAFCRVIRGAVYEFVFCRNGFSSTSLNGRALTGEIIPHQPAGSRNRVTLSLPVE
jgi:cellobiose phosphorylase